MNFIAVLDYEHLDNAMFLTSFARSLSRKKNRGIILHGDSEYTERIIQTGVMREDAQIRAIKELNHRLVALFADEGISTISLNGFQKSLVKTDGKRVVIDKKQILNFPKEPMLLISNLGLNTVTGKPVPIPLQKLSVAIHKGFDLDGIDLFSIKESAEIIREDLPKLIDLDECSNEFKEEHIPKNFRNESLTIRLNSASAF
jgi:hypothetical protein